MITTRGSSTANQASLESNDLFKPTTDRSAIQGLNNKSTLKPEILSQLLDPSQPSNALGQLSQVSSLLTLSNDLSDLIRKVAQADRSYLEQTVAEINKMLESRGVKSHAIIEKKDGYMYITLPKACFDSEPLENDHKTGPKAQAELGRLGDIVESLGLKFGADYVFAVKHDFNKTTVTGISLRFNLTPAQEPLTIAEISNMTPQEIFKRSAEIWRSGDITDANVANSYREAFLKIIKTSGTAAERQLAAAFLINFSERYCDIMQASIPANDMIQAAQTLRGLNASDIAPEAPLIGSIIEKGIKIAQTIPSDAQIISLPKYSGTDFFKKIEAQERKLGISQEMCERAEKELGEIFRIVSERAKHELTPLQRKDPEKILAIIHRVLEDNFCHEIRGQSSLIEGLATHQIDCDIATYIYTEVGRKMGLELEPYIAILGPEIAHVVVGYQKDGVTKYWEANRVNNSNEKPIYSDQQSFYDRLRQAGFEPEVVDGRCLWPMSEDMISRSNEAGIKQQQRR